MGVFTLHYDSALAPAVGGTFYVPVLTARPYDASGYFGPTGDAAGFAALSDLTNNIPAGNVLAGTFGANKTGGADTGQYTFPGVLLVKSAATTMLTVNSSGVGIGSVAPSGSDDLLHVEYSAAGINGSTSIAVYNRNTGNIAEATMHLFGGNVSITGATGGANMKVSSFSAAQGGNNNIIAQHGINDGTSPGTFNLIQYDLKNINFYTGNGLTGGSFATQLGFSVVPTATGVNSLTVKSGGPGSSAVLSAVGEANINIAYRSVGSNGHFFQTEGVNATNQVFISSTASATRYLTLTGSNGGNPTISTSAGSVSLGTAAGTTGVVIDGTAFGAATASLRLNGLTSGAAASVGTLTNAPSAGNPNFWIPVSIAGTVRYLPAW